MNKPILSIVIPTKNRYETLLKVINSILKFNSNQFELVIHDNSDDNIKIKKYLSGLKDMRLKYFYTTDKLSQTGNSNLAVEKSIGEYVCFIGDDDGVMPNIVEVTKWMKENGFKALKSYKPSYYWPNQKSNYLSNDASGVLKYKKWKEDSYQIIKTKEALNYTLSKGGGTIKKLPCLYHGIVERRTLNLIYKVAGTFFPGPSPDMANAIALTQVIDSYVLVNYPVIISGKSAKSIGGAGVLHKHISKIEEVKHLPEDTCKNWDERIPKYWTGPTIWAESVIKALEKFQNKEAIEKINFSYLYAHLEVFHKIQSKEIFKDFVVEKTVMYYLLKFKIYLHRAKTFIQNRIGVVKKINNIKDMESVIKILN
ncbi:glycosyltransferase [Tenacibaculum sp. FZY0031]|uniref:glycosyltransferase family 2 protein n=1 Tax=Tenacibaculum sp. FZY0031 TaxID=3116648 RepID=UPI002EC20717|nr:glycosyltransferase [Tenacibaculum sp. FZY0031]